MILPQKHIKLSESVFGLGCFILILLEKPKSVDKLWVDYQDNFIKGIFPPIHSFDNFILTLDYLYIIGAVEVNNGGIIIKCD